MTSVEDDKKVKVWEISGESIGIGLGYIPVLGGIVSGVFKYFWEKNSPKDDTNKFKIMLIKLHNEIIYEIKEEIEKNNIEMAKNRFESIQDLCSEYMKAYNNWNNNRNNKKLKEVLRTEFICVKNIIINTIRLYNNDYSAHIGILISNMLFVLLLMQKKKVMNGVLVMRLLKILIIH